MLTKITLSRRMAAFVLALILSFWMLGVQMGTAGVLSDQKTVHLSCGDAPEALCAALTKAIFDKQNIQRTANLNQADLEMALVMTKIETSYLVARLDWTETGSKPKSGPEIEFSVMDAELSDVSFGQYVEALLSISKPPL